MLVNIGKFEGISSPLDLIKRIMESGEYATVAPDDDPKEVEQVIGVMTDDEKALYTARDMVVDAIELTREAIRSKQGDESHLRDQLDALEEYHQLVNRFFWVTLKMRFREAMDIPDVIGIGVRPGYQVVVFSEHLSPVAQEFLEILEAAMAQMHNCADCEKYDQCVLPTKKSPDQIAAEQAAAAGKLN